jgi:hypothetical protein
MVGILVHNKQCCNLWFLKEGKYDELLSMAEREIYYNTSAPEELLLKTQSAGIAHFRIIKD